MTPAQPTAGWESTQLFPGQFTGEFTGGCPDAATDPANVLCDHRTAIVDVPAGFWATHAGGVRITLDTLNTENEFHGLEVYQDGVLVASASFEEPTVFLAAAEGTYDVRVSGTINIPTFNDAYAGTVALEAAQVVAP